MIVMVDDFLMWYATLSKIKNFRWAKFWALVTAILIFAIVWCWRSGEFGWVTALLMPLLMAGTSALEALALSQREANLRRYLEKLQQAARLATLEEAAFTDRSVTIDGWESNANSDAETDAGVATAAQPGARYNDAGKLRLCQFYAFLYCVVELRLTGEGKLNRMLGIPAGRYREWISGLASGDLNIVSISESKTSVAEIDFQEALHRVASHQGDATMWEFPIKVYSKDANWREYNPNKIELERGRVVTINRGRPGDAPLLPVYPQRLKDLKI